MSLSNLTEDVGEENSGLNVADEANVIENVNLVLHCAATLDLDTISPSNVNINSLCTRRMLELCNQLKNCQGFQHFSKAYVNSEKEEVEEEIYEASKDPEKNV